jgi:hypothetical protein
MQATDDPGTRYRGQGYTALPAYLDRVLCDAVTAQFMGDVAKGRAFPRRKESALVPGVSNELYTNGYSPLRTFHWGMTPAISALVGCALVPSFGYLRIYMRGDICRVHSDRRSCEHSLSLTLSLGSDLPWELEIATLPTSADRGRPRADFGGDAYEAFAMGVGDAVLYQGTRFRHGRMTPNPNSGSVHLFLHWVDPAGPHADCAFDPEGRAMRAEVSPREADSRSES